MWKALSSRVPAGLATLVAAGLVARIFIRPLEYQWDFRVYYDAAGAFLAGLDPYDANARLSVSSHFVNLPFVYPPLTLHAFAVFRKLSLLPAMHVWLGLKVLALAMLFRIWSRVFVSLRWDVATIAFFLLAFGSTLLTDFATGNVSTFEQLMLWAGFEALVEGRWVKFSVLVVLAAQFKLLPVFFLVLLLTAFERPHWGAFAGAVAAFAAVFSLNALLYPEGLWAFFQQASSIDERGFINPSMLAFVQDVADKLTAWFMNRPVAIGRWVYGVVALVVVAMSARVGVIHRRRVGIPDRRVLVLFACAVYALVAPRFKNYSYILLLAPAAWLVWGSKISKHLPIVFALVAFPMVGTFEQTSVFITFMVPYMSLLAGVWIWASYRRELLAPVAAESNTLSGGRPI
ncbi:MAG: glycosyltransferase 87 family protein [Myxococcaceae bacterium]